MSESNMTDQPAAPPTAPPEGNTRQGAAAPVRPNLLPRPVTPAPQRAAPAPALLPDAPNAAPAPRPPAPPPAVPPITFAASPATAPMAAATPAPPPSPAAPAPAPPAPCLESYLSGAPEARLRDLLAFALAIESGKGEPPAALRDKAEAELQAHAFRTLHNQVEAIRLDAARDQLARLRQTPGFRGMLAANLLALAIAGAVLLALRAVVGP